MALRLIHEEEASVARAASHPLIRGWACQSLTNLPAREVAVIVASRAERFNDVIQSLVQCVPLGGIALGGDISRVYIPELPFGLIRLAGTLPDDRLDDARLLESVEQSELYLKTVPVRGLLHRKIRSRHALRPAAQAYVKWSILKPLVEMAELDLEHIVGLDKIRQQTSRGC